MGCKPAKVAAAADEVTDEKYVGGDSSQLDLPPGTCVIAIDFGTSRSAFSYGFVGPKGANVEINFGCPTDSLLNEGVAVKAETCVILDQSMKAVGFGLKGRKTLYAQKKEDVSHMFKWFKMYLKDIKSDSDESVMVSDHNGKQVSLFLVITQALYYIAKSALDEVNLKSLSTRTFQDIYWAVTVPAIWSAAASGFMRRAALKAGMITSQLSLKLMLVREPEAACLDLLNDIDKKSHPVQVPVGAEMLILDLGGGTNDMSFVKILSQDPLNCQELKEAAGGTGGAARIDQSVLAMLKDLFGEERFGKIEKLPALLDLMDMWETFKITFDGKMTFAMKLGDMIDALQEEHPDEIINVEVINKLVSDYNNRHPPSERVSNVRLKIDVPDTIVRKWFDSVVDVIIKDLDVQLRLPACSGVNFLYLVGGFSSSKYLTEKVTDHIKKNFGYRNITIFPATKPDVAIVRGAVRALLNAKQPLISDHVSSKCYGIKTSMMYVPGKHDGSKIFYVDGNAMVSLYHMFVAKGDRLPLDYVTPEQVFSPQSVNMTTVTLQLYTLDDITVKKDSVIYMDDPRLKLERALSVPLNLAVDYVERRLRVSIKFGMEIQLLAKDKLGKFYEAATSESYLS